MFRLLLISIVTLIFLGCENKDIKVHAKEKKIGVLVVSHGSHSEKWREMVAATTDSIKLEILSNENISGIKNAFMEYTEPSIATQMKKFDDEGYTDIIIVPLLLTVSGHSFDDIPHILGLKNSQVEIDKLKQEKIDIYKAKANVEIAPLLNFSEILGENLVRRIASLSKNPENEGCVLVAYGSQAYNKEWKILMNDMKNEIKLNVGIEKCEFSWCGHIVNYDTKPTTDAINTILSEKDKVIVIPVLVAFDEMFQIDIIGTAIEKSNESKNVIYRPDAILPDENIEKWIISISNDIAKKF